MAVRTAKKRRLRYGRLCSSSSCISLETGSCGATQNQTCFAPSRSGMKSTRKTGITAPAVSLKRRRLTCHFAPVVWCASTNVTAPVDVGDQVREQRGPGGNQHPDERQQKACGSRYRGPQQQPAADRITRRQVRTGKRPCLAHCLA